jgi:hypothetical protein
VPTAGSGTRSNGSPPPGPGWIAIAALILAFVAITGRSARFLPVALPSAVIAVLLSLLVLQKARTSRNPAGAGQAAAALVIGAVALLLGLQTARSSSAAPEGPQPMGAVQAPAAPQGGLWPATTIPIVAEPLPVPELLRPESIRASRTAPANFDSRRNRVTYAADNVLDRDPTTAWRVPGKGIGQTLTARWNRPVHVTSVGILPGYAKRDPYSGVDRFLENRRVRAVRYRFSDGSSVHARLRDSRQVQRTRTDVVTTSVTVEILDTSPGPRRDFTAISELEIAGREAP